MKHRLLSPALDDLDNIEAAVTERFGAAVAAKVYTDLFDLFDLLADHQHMGILRPDLTDEPLRFFNSGPTGSSTNPAIPC